MSTAPWQEQNNRYLAASLQWLRLRLQQLAPEEHFVSAPGARPPVEPNAPPPGRLSRWLGGNPLPPTRDALPLPGGERAPADDRLTAAAAEREASAASMDQPPALVLLAQRLGMSTFERDTLLLCAAVEFDPAFAAAYARGHGNMARTHPTFGLALATLDDPAWDALSAHRPLRRSRLIEVTQPGATPLTSSPIRVDERIVNLLKGLNVLDDRLATLLTPVGEGEGDALSGSQHTAVDTILRQLRDAAAESVLPVVQLIGADAGGKIAVAHATSLTLNRRLYRVGAEALPPQVADIETLARLWQRENVLLPVALYLDAENVEGMSADIQAAFHRFLSRGVGLVFVGVREVPVRFNGPSVSVDVKKPTAAEQYDAWIALLRERTPDEAPAPTAERLAGQFDLNLGDIREATTAALKLPATQGAVWERIWDTCRDRTRPRLDSLAQRLDVKATWDDLVLPDEQMTLMRQIAGQVRGRHTVYGEWGFSLKMNRGFGITALFAGESGTGKTMAAEVIATDLRLNLYRIDLSAVVSKYIGETEKNLRKLFDAAEEGGAILFFDEADALFGKRSEVKDSHDRYANIEINYLLQRMESFSGLAILATNMKMALDPAFMRRLRFIVNFQFPGVKERQLIWRKAIPEQTPKEAVDYDRLARLNVTGGNIHSIAVNAAFLAAANDTPVTMPLLLSAARTELRKLEKPFSEAEFR
jgi:ATPase family associated with various cellular activities (AAA)/Winged helix domain, variant